MEFDHQNPVDYGMDTLKIGHFTHRPETFPCAADSQLLRSNKCAYPGLSAELIGMIVHSLNISVQIVKPPRGMNVSDQWAFLLEQLETGAIHTTDLCWVRTQQKNATYTFNNFPLISGTLSALVSDDLSLTKHAAHLSSRAFYFLSVFNAELWLAAAACLIGVKVYSILLARIRASYHHVHTQTGVVNNSLLIVIALFVTFFTSLYSNGVLARLLVNDQSEPFKSLKGLAQSIYSDQQYQLVVEPKQAWAEFFERKFEWTPDKELLSKALQKHPSINSDVFADAKGRQQALDNRSVFIDWTYSNLYQKSITCNARVVYFSHFYPWKCFMMFHKSVNETLIGRIDHLVQDSGSLFEAIRVRYNHFLEQRRASCQGYHRFNPYFIEFEDTYGLFGFLAVGMLIAGFMLLLEMCARVGQILTNSNKMKIVRRK